MDAKIKLLGILVVLLLAACSGAPPVPVDDEVDTRVRVPASEDSAGVQVYSLQNPAVKELTAQAVVAENAGELDKASGYLERALRIEPLSLIHISEPTRRRDSSRMPSSA